ncbi:hypothetical protein ONZ45_g13104 [Pleurotus djamor]|nr:hypothetical protein ONZ45_g13104 [Pleurotus djamor]
MSASITLAQQRNRTEVDDDSRGEAGGLVLFLGNLSFLDPPTHMRPKPNVHLDDITIAVPNTSRFELVSDNAHNYTIQAAPMKSMKQDEDMLARRRQRRDWDSKVESSSSELES